MFALREENLSNYYISLLRLRGYLLSRFYISDFRRSQYFSCAVRQMGGLLIFDCQIVSFFGALCGLYLINFGNL